MLSQRFVLLSVFGLALLTIANVYGDEDVNIPDDPIDENAPKLKVRVYYETLCPDSMRFICNQLYYSMVGNNRLPLTELEFVPYGKVSSWTSPITNRTALYCQHGQTECELNALHACIVEHYDVQQQMQLINCLMYGYSTDIDECGGKLGIDVSAAKQCKATRKTEDILKKYGMETDALDLSFVPSITVDGTFDRGEQRTLLNYFDKVFCRKYEEKYLKKLDKC